MLRPTMGGMFYAIGLSELAYDCPLPARTAVDHLGQDLARRVNNICCWVNDLHAYPAETARGDTFNLVTIFNREHGRTVAQAACVRNVINAELAVLDLLLAPTQDADFNRYLGGLKDMVAAIVHWSAISARYATADAGTGDGR